MCIILRYIIIPLSVLFFVSNVNAQGLVTSSFSDAMSSDTFVTEPSANPQPEKKASSPDYKRDPAIDYNRVIANKLFPDARNVSSEIIIINPDKRYNKINTGTGRIIEIDLPETSSQKWAFEYDKKLLKIIKKSKNSNLLNVQFQTIGQGTTKIYLDCIDNSGSAPKVLGSKVINITIGK